MATNAPLRRHFPRSAVFLTSVLTGCAGAAPAPGPAPAASITPKATASTTLTVDADRALQTPGGSAFVAPKGWTVTLGTNITTLVAPDREVSIHFVERHEPSGAAAIASAWADAAPKRSP